MILFRCYLRTVFMYLTLVGVIRLMGKRQIGQMGPSEFVVTMMAANLTTGPLEDPEAPIVYSLIAVFTILGAELILSLLTMGSIPLRRLVCGKPVILIDNGILEEGALRRTRVTLDELTSRLRQQQVMAVTDVQYAILETDGSLSVFPYPACMPPTAKDLGVTPGETPLPVTILENGKLLTENLKRAGKDRAWLSRVLRDRGATEKETLLLTLDPRGKICFLRKNP